MGNLCSADVNAARERDDGNFSNVIYDVSAGEQQQQPTQKQPQKATSTTITTTTATPAPAATAAPAPAPAAPVKLDPKDFFVSRRTNEVIVREPGRIAGQAFTLEECKNCDIYLLDHSAAVNIDACEDCRIFIGPCESSVFLREMTRCQVIVAAQQLRLRDCTDLSLLIFVSASQPVIESSSDLRLSCFTGPTYPQLRAHFAAASLNVWNSEWSNVHDFHKETGLHWSYLPFGTTWRELGFKDIAEVTDGRVRELSRDDDDKDDASEHLATPNSWGRRPFASVEKTLVLVHTTDAALAWRVHAALQPLLQVDASSSTPSTVLLRTRSVAAAGSLRSIVASLLAAPEHTAVRRTIESEKRTLVGFELDGANCAERAKDAIQARLGARVAADATIVFAGASAPSAIQAFFEPVAV